MEQHGQCRLQWTITIYNIDNSTVLSPPLVIGASVACYLLLAKNVLALQHRISWSSPGLLDDCRQLLPRKTCPSLTVLCCALDTRKKDATHILRGKLRPITDLSETFDQLRSRNNDFLTSWKCLPRNWAWARSQVRKEQLAGRRWSVNDNLAADEASYRFETLDNGQSYRFDTAGNKCSVDNELQELLEDTLDQIDDASICTRSKWCQTEAGPLPHISSQWLLHLSRPTHPPKPNTPQTYWWWWDDGPVKIIQNTFFLILNMFVWCTLFHVFWFRQRWYRKVWNCKNDEQEIQNGKWRKYSPASRMCPVITCTCDRPTTTTNCICPDPKYTLASTIDIFFLFGDQNLK